MQSGTTASAANIIADPIDPAATQRVGHIGRHNKFKVDSTDRLKQLASCGVTEDLSAFEEVGQRSEHVLGDELRDEGDHGVEAILKTAASTSLTFLMSTKSTSLKYVGRKACIIVAEKL